jgi:hypothetical protein
MCSITIIINVCSGEAGSIHDACMLRRSPIYEQMQTKPVMFPGDTHIIGDPAYPIKENLLVAFKNNGRLTRREDKYNRALSAARSCIERAFALLKGRFRRLKFLDMSNIERIPYVIVACCVLHNICLKLHDAIDIPAEDADVEQPVEYEGQFVAVEDKKAGIAKRNRIADDLFG